MYISKKPLQGHEAVFDYLVSSKSRTDFKSVLPYIQKTDIRNGRMGLKTAKNPIKPQKK